MHRPPTTLRTSKSHEDLLTPYSSGTRDSHNHGSSSVSPGKVWTPQPHHRTLTLRHTLGDGSSEEVRRESVRLSAILNDDDLMGDIQIRVDSPEPERKRQTLPRDGLFSDWLPQKPFQPASSSSSSSATSSKSNVRGSEAAGTPVTDVLNQPPPSAPPVFGRKPNDSPWKHHRKSFSVGTKWVTCSMSLCQQLLCYLLLCCVDLLFKQFVYVYSVLAVFGIGKSSKLSTASSGYAVYCTVEYPPTHHFQYGVCVCVCVCVCVQQCSISRAESSTHHTQSHRRQCTGHHVHYWHIILWYPHWITGEL